MSSSSGAVVGDEKTSQKLFFAAARGQRTNLCASLSFAGRVSLPVRGTQSTCVRMLSRHVTRRVITSRHAFAGSARAQEANQIKVSVDVVTSRRMTSHHHVTRRVITSRLYVTRWITASRHITSNVASLAWHIDARLCRRAEKEKGEGLNCLEASTGLSVKISLQQTKPVHNTLQTREDSSCWVNKLNASAKSNASVQSGIGASFIGLE